MRETLAQPRREFITAAAVTATIMVRALRFDALIDARAFTVVREEALSS
jgi:hypothetical protein